MSWARFGEGSDVYLFETAESDGREVECCGCFLGHGSPTFSDPAQLIAHIEEHRQSGHLVPDGVRSGLEAWIMEVASRGEKP